STFISMIRHPPISTLFPYNDALPISFEQPDGLIPFLITPDEAMEHIRQQLHSLGERILGLFDGNTVEQAQDTLAQAEAAGEYARSEEQTSELQSPCNLVCRLLLEKKK